MSAQGQFSGRNVADVYKNTLFQSEITAIQNFLFLNVNGFCSDHRTRLFPGDAKMQL